MQTVFASPWLIWGISGAAVAGVLVRPFGLPEAVWAVAGAALIVALGLLPPAAAWQGVTAGTDVYLFLTGMMLLSEVARQEGLFAWLAVHAARAARGSAARLFTLVFIIGTLVTIFLSNDATAVVLTPAVAAMAGAARAADALPYLLICAFVANAASFVLPISNPANLVIYGGHMPALPDWLLQFGPASAAAILATYAVLRLSQLRHLRAPIESAVPVPALPPGGATAGAGLVAAAVALMAASAAGLDLGLPTFLCGTVTMLIVRIVARTTLPAILARISWSVLPLVAGLFVLVAALQRTGALDALAAWLHGIVARHPAEAPWIAGLGIAFASNLINNLPAGLMAAHVLPGAPPSVTAATLIGVDIGPNLSVTGSLATILWLVVLRREKIAVSAWSFLRLGCAVMLPALLVSLALTEKSFLVLFFKKELLS